MKAPKLPVGSLVILSFAFIAAAPRVRVLVDPINVHDKDDAALARGKLLTLNEKIVLAPAPNKDGKVYPKVVLDLGWNIEEFAPFPGIDLSCPADVARECSDSELQKLQAELPVVVSDAGHNESPKGNRSDIPTAKDMAVKPAVKMKKLPWYPDRKATLAAVEEIRAGEQVPQEDSSPFLHEGKATQVLSLLARSFLTRCLQSEKVPAPNFKPMRYPGEEYFGQYENPAWVEYVEKTTGSKPYIAAEIASESLDRPKAPDEKSTYDWNGNYLFAMNHRSAYANFMLFGAGDPGVRATEEYYPSGIKPQKAGARFSRGFLPSADFVKPGMFISWHTETANAVGAPIIDRVQTLYPRVRAGGAAPQLASLHGSPEVDPDPKSKQFAASLSEHAAEAQRLYIQYVRNQPLLPGQLTASKNPGAIFLLRAVRARECYLHEAYDSTGATRGFSEKILSKNKDGKVNPDGTIDPNPKALLSVQVSKDGQPGPKLEYPVNPLAVADARGFLGSLVTRFCRNPDPAVAQKN